MIDLDHLMDLESKATEGPWRHGTHERYHVFCPHDDGLAGVGGERVLLRMNEHYAHDFEAALIAALRNAAKEMMAELRALRELEGAVRSHHSAWGALSERVLTALAAVEKARGG